MTVLLLAGCSRASLLEGLDERQANEVMAVLMNNNIAIEKRNDGKRGYSVLVAADELPAAVDLIGREQVPSPARRHIDSYFPADALVSTPQAERARLYSAVEQRLEESLSLIDGVASARVHVNYDVAEGQGRQEGAAPSRMAALIVARENADAPVLVAEVKRFLRNSFSRLGYDDISVIVTRETLPRVPLGDIRELGGRPPPSWVLGGLSVLLLSVAALAMVSRAPRRFRAWRRLRSWRQGAIH